MGAASQSFQGSSSGSPENIGTMDELFVLDKSFLMGFVFLVFDCGWKKIGPYKYSLILSPERKNTCWKCCAVNQGDVSFPCKVPGGTAAQAGE